MILLKMVKCALALCHSNGDVERSFSANKRILANKNISLGEEAIIGFRAIKTAVEECGTVDKAPILLESDLLKVANSSHRIHMEHPRCENAKQGQRETEKSKQETYRRKLYGIRAEGKRFT